jgi:hypothetical protein
MQPAGHTRTAAHTIPNAAAAVVEVALRLLWTGQQVVEQLVQHSGDWRLVELSIAAVSVVKRSR